MLFRSNDIFVKPKTPNPIVFGAVLGYNDNNEKLIYELINYLKSAKVEYNQNIYDGEDRELYISVSLDDLKRKHLFKK